MPITPVTHSTTLPALSAAGPDRRDAAMASLAPQLAQRIWCGQACGAVSLPAVPTGYAALDGHLPGGGWPRQGVTEVLQPQDGVAEWRLLLPSLAPLLTDKQVIVAIACPHEPFLPGLQQAKVGPAQLIWVRAGTAAQGLWAAEQAIKSASPAAVLAWLPHARAEQIRRLQIHALDCDAPVFLMRPATAQHEASAAPLRVLVTPAGPSHLGLRILKRRGAAHEGVIALRSIPSRLATVMPSRPRLPREGVTDDSPQQGYAALAGTSAPIVDIAGRDR